MYNEGHPPPSGAAINAGISLVHMIRNVLCTLFRRMKQKQLVSVSLSTVTCLVRIFVIQDGRQP